MKGLRQVGTKPLDSGTRASPICLVPGEFPITLHISPSSLSCIQCGMTPKRKRNIRKLTVLEALAREPSWVSAGLLRGRQLIATMTLRNLQMALLRYCRWGLVDRKPNGHSRAFLYRINAKGQ